MGTSSRRRNLGTAAGAVTAGLFALFDLEQWVEAYLSDNFHNDFTFYYSAARIGLAHGWSHIYDLGLMQTELDAVRSKIKIAELARYISPPPVAWLATPFTALQYPVAYWLWSALLLAALAGAWYLAAPGAGRVRLVFLAAALGWLPVIYGLQLGQPGLFVAVGVAGCYALLRSGRDFWAGVALGALALKPQLAFLVPPALLVAGRYRAFAGSAVALGVLALASAAALGPAGLSDYQARLSFAAGVPVNRDLTLAPILGSLSLTGLVQVAIALWSLALAYRMRRRGPEWMLIPALVGGMLATPYLHIDDLVMLGLGAWLCLRCPGPAWSRAYVLAGVIAVEGLPIWGPVPLIAAELGALILISIAASRAPARQSDADPAPLEASARQVS